MHIPILALGRIQVQGIESFGEIILHADILIYHAETMSIWTTFGDCTLQMRTAIPKLLKLSYTTVNRNSAFSTTVTSGNKGQVDLVSLSQNDQVYSVYTDSSGKVSIPHKLVPGCVVLVVTGQNTQYSHISVMEGPAITYTMNPLPSFFGAITPSKAYAVRKDTLGEDRPIGTLIASHDYTHNEVVMTQ